MQIIGVFTTGVDVVAPTGTTTTTRQPVDVISTGAATVVTTGVAVTTGAASVTGRRITRETTTFIAS
jgi:hypothetical protein